LIFRQVVACGFDLDMCGVEKHQDGFSRCFLTVGFYAKSRTKMEI
jgi:hypothetical protein